MKETLSDAHLEQLRDQCVHPRDLAMVDFLISTGIRVGELVKLNRSDINFNERECIVLGKGDKERPVYFDAKTKILEQVQRLLGHAEIDTTLHYALVNQSNVKISHRKYMC